MASNGGRRSVERRQHDRRGVAWNDRLRTFLARNLFHSLQGMTFGDWWRLLRRHRFAIDPPHWPRAMLQTAVSLSNSINARRERRAYGPRIDVTEVHRPLFILGHWRSGTTHLHNLLDLDAQFACPNLLQALNPLTFFRTESKMVPIASRLTVRRRPQDDVALGVGMPTEDEFALCAMTSLSPYMGWAFPKGEYDYGKYLTFRGVPEEEVARWKSALALFLKKLTLKYERPLVLKSPPHTARIRLLLEVVPDARFIHIHRNPYSVFQSTRHLHDAVAPYFRFQAGESFAADDRIIGTYKQMYNAFFEDRALIPEGRFCEVAFEELESRPMAVVGSIYEALGLAGFDEIRPGLECYLGTVAGYRKNRHDELPEPLRHRIVREWGRCFDEWRYDPRVRTGSGAGN